MNKLNKLVKYCPVNRSYESNIRKLVNFHNYTPAYKNGKRIYYWFLKRDKEGYYYLDLGIEKFREIKYLYTNNLSEAINLLGPACEEFKKWNYELGKFYDELVIIYPK